MNCTCFRMDISDVLSTNSHITRAHGNSLNVNCAGKYNYSQYLSQTMIWSVHLNLKLWLLNFISHLEKVLSLYEHYIFVKPQIYSVAWSCAILIVQSGQL